MKRLLRVYRLSSIAGPATLVLVAAIVVLAAGPKHDEVPAFVVIACVAAIAGVRAASARLGRRGRRTPRAVLGEQPRDSFESRDRDDA